MQRWPHQVQAVADVKAAIKAGERRIVLCSPTGGGKTVITMDLMQWAVELWMQISLYTNRKMLLRQLHERLDGAGVAHGVRAAGWPMDEWQTVQLSSIQTEFIRDMAVHKAHLVVIDEAHLNSSGMVQDLIAKHEAAVEDLVVLGLTATPVDLGHIYSKLIFAGKNADMLACGAHVPCRMFAPDEPECRKLKPVKTGELLYKDIRKAIMTPVIAGRVWEHWTRNNPERKPTILFAPGVPESLWFAKTLVGMGATAAHIDGSDVWVDGKIYKKDEQAREDVIERVRGGDIQIICNRFVLREGIDIPELYCGILATIFGKVSSYVQSVGRLLRAHPSMDHVVLIDHGGNYWRHGHPSADREWSLAYGDNVISGARHTDLQEGKKPEPIVCFACSAVRAGGPKCPACGHESSQRIRRVIQQDGTIKERYGKIFKQITRTKKDNTQKLWNSYYHRAKRSKNGMTFAQAEGLFVKEQGYYPPRDLDAMPKDNFMWHQRVSDVPSSALSWENLKATKSTSRSLVDD